MAARSVATPLTAGREHLFDPFAQAEQAVIEALGTDAERGLSAGEVARRLQQDGPNEIASTPRIPTWRKVVSQFNDPLIYLLTVASMISVVAWAFEGASGLPVDALVIAIIVVLNAVIGFVQEARAGNAVAALQDLTEVSSTVVRDGVSLRIPSSGLVRGDLLVLGEGDSVGADARLVQVAALRVNESSLTGESAAVEKNLAVLGASQPLADRTNMVFKVTAVTQGTGRAVVTATGMDTAMGDIARMLEATVQPPTPLEREIAVVGKLLGSAVVVIAVVVMATIWLISDIHTLADAVTVLLLGVSLAVAAVPEGLPAILSVVLSIGVQRMARQQAIVKTLSSVETLGSASIICTDKTGTLTRNEMTVRRIATVSGGVTVTGVGYTPDGEVQFAGENDEVRAEVLAVLCGGSLASDAELQQVDGVWGILGDPTEAAFLVAERKLGVDERRRQRFTRIGEVPFTSERKLMSSIEIDHEHDELPVIISKGAPAVLLERCTHARRGLEVIPLDTALRHRIVGDVESMSSEALRTLSVAYRPLSGAALDDVTRRLSSGTEVPAGLEKDLIFLGTVGIMDPARPEVAPAVREAARAGIRVLMITGDHPSTARRIAQDLGIGGHDDVPLTGTEIDRLDPADLRAAIGRTSVYARVTPANKLRLVDALREDGNVVAMTGDGVNDAPALKLADIGIAMGVTGTEVTKEAASMVLADDNFATIVSAVRQGRVIFENIRKFLRYLLSSNIGEVFTVFGGVVLAGVIGLRDASSATVVLPLLATQILWVNLITDSAPALAMGVDPETDDVMARHPRRMSDRIIDTRMWLGVLFIGAVIAVATLLALDIFLPGGLVDGHDSLTVARTAAFTTLVLAQLFNVFNCRSETTSAFYRPFVNLWLWAAVGLGVLAQLLVVQTPWLQAAFGTAALDPTHWLVCLALASSVLWFGEIRKLFIRRKFT
jgi:Ca2+-transporting ATPase